jgi:hypothetical protein
MVLEVSKRPGGQISLRWVRAGPERVTVSLLLAARELMQGAREEMGAG